MKFKFFQEVEKNRLVVNWDSIFGEEYPDGQFGRTPTTYRNISWDNLCAELISLFPCTVSKIVYRDETFTNGSPIIDVGDRIDEVEVQIIYEKF